jgi:hypothetical protein
MTTPHMIISQIEAHLPEIKRRLTPEDAKTFENLYYAISDQLAEGADPRQSTAQLQELLAQYPAVEEIIRERATDLFTTPVAPSIAHPHMSDLQGSSGPASVFELGERSSNSQPTTTSEVSITDLKTDKGVVYMSNQQPKQSSPIEGKWTPEVILQFFKEGVTAILAMLLVGYTVFLANRTFDFAGDTQKMSDGKDVLLLMMGVAGVVIGYYFGRVPADARAAQAQEQAREATIHSEQVSANAEQIAEQVQRTLLRLSPANRRGDSAANLESDVAEDMQQLETKVAELRSLTRRRR